LREVAAATEAYHRAMEIDPKLAHPHSHLGDIYVEQKRYEEALTQYGQAIELEPGRSLFYKWRAMTYLLMGRDSDAEADLREASRLRPSDIRVYVWLWQIHMRRGDTAAAAQALAEAGRYVDDDWLRALLDHLAGRMDYGQLLAAAGDDVEKLCEAYYYAGERLRVEGRAEDARQAFVRCVETGLIESAEYQLAEGRLAG
jgi:lipoprotein NlpI